MIEQVNMMTQYMVVEKFREGCCEEVYQRFNTKGRMLPDGLHYLSSWINKDHDICFQLMETRDESLFRNWFHQWSDLVEFEVYPVDGT